MYMEVPRHWRLQSDRQLKGVVCEAGHPVFPKHPFCPEGHRTSIHADFENPGIKTDITVTTKPAEVLGSD